MLKITTETLHLPKKTVQWKGTLDYQVAFVEGIQLEVRRQANSTLFNVFVQGTKVSEAVDLLYARRQALYEVEEILAQIQTGLNKLWSNTP